MNILSPKFISGQNWYQLRVREQEYPLRKLAAHVGVYV